MSPASKNPSGSWRKPIQSSWRDFEIAADLDVPADRAASQRREMGLPRSTGIELSQHCVHVPAVASLVDPLGGSDVLARHCASSIADESGRGCAGLLVVVVAAGGDVDRRDRGRDGERDGRPAGSGRTLSRMYFIAIFQTANPSAL